MVGVPGKYKGCNTCRLRRAKCDNERPFCRKCIDSGRECKGYDRETVFIIGTLEDGGRCSSHPPRVLKGSKRAKAAAKNEEDEKLDLVPVEPLQPAWDDLVSLSNLGTVYQVQIAALHTSLQMIIRDKAEGENNNKFTRLSFPPYSPADTRPSLQEDEFALRSQCMIHLSPTDASGSSESTATDSIFLFLYEICAALLNRKASFLAGQEWMTAPWENHPKSVFDKLFDNVVLLPSILARADRILPHDPTLARRLMAQDLLGNCINVDRQLEEWHNSVILAAGDQSRLFWIEDPDGSGAQIPFADTFAFRDSITAVMFIYYWTSLIVFYPCAEQLQQAIFQPVLDAFPQIYPNLPPNLHIDPQRYSHKEVREMAANVCRGLDFALSTTVQPDMLVVPVYVVEQFYGAINISTGDGALELMWLEAFKMRLTAKGQDIADVIQSRNWFELAQY
ncbi:putative c6 zinc finger domain-containing protein [Phaeoacremonium minimum UCRPA7]|uniref:Putative c6 zinc finger domain-containing protein n=1 Tax=Phaeoacremonium minimum (strain UCR-PA7) TaxID=1286976 RepID=R8BSE5_PHAM7|nr:putative c6 zinc finger domain-containing protein [Phaeoacremonium minimum UCRPA7]EOO02220.1 putative c6 zinc finger domain-containing protein [Phaeoacremonium minimum UCRPA7]